MNVLILQPPLTQLNTPYPSGAYLRAFFSEIRRLQSGSTQSDLSENIPIFLKHYKSPPCDVLALAPIGSVRWIDLSNLLYREIFCAAGLKKLFLLTEKKALSFADTAEKKGKTDAAFNVRRYIMRQDSWISHIDDIQAILCGGSGFPHKSGRELCHDFVRSAHMPRGRRMETYIAAKNGNVTADDARFLATLAVEDLCDYITAVYDPYFEPVRYASSLAESAETFTEIEKALVSPLMTDFFEPLLEQILLPFVEDGSNWLVCVSVPFPGTLAGALACGRAVKCLFAERALILLGGGYVNTELRSLTSRQSDCKLFSYVDCLVYDRGYGSLLELLRQCGNLSKKPASGTEQPEGDSVFSDAANVFERVLPETAETDFSAAEIFFTKTLVPDYTDIDFSLYPRMADETNPMHRLWSDGAWLKAYLAHGCYWQRCFFCDTTLDYVKNFCIAQVDSLFTGLADQAEKTGVYGVHFVDEAAPPRSLRQFALLNCRRRQNRLTFWGNIRFEKSFSRHTADLLAYGGLSGVTGGLEIAAADGLESVEKGINIETLVGACAAFKEAGILVHAYMIFGYWEETPQMLADSMETLRQLFECRLLDSAFWHKFVLTRHSRLYAEWQKGLCPDLRPVFSDRTDKTAAKGKKTEPGSSGRFAENDLRFEDENKSQKYAAPLDNALRAWMRGENLRTNIQKWFPFAIPKPSVPAGFIARHIAAYEKKRDAENRACVSFFSGKNECPPNKTCYWLGGKPVVVFSRSGSGKAYIHWLYMDEEFCVQTTAENAVLFAETLYKLRPESPECHCEKNMRILVSSGFPAEEFVGKGLILA